LIAIYVDSYSHSTWLDAATVLPPDVQYAAAHVFPVGIIVHASSLFAFAKLLSVWMCCTCVTAVPPAVVQSDEDAVHEFPVATFSHATSFAAVTLLPPLAVQLAATHVCPDDAKDWLHAPPFEHGVLPHSSTSRLQLSPSQPFGQVQAYESVPSTHTPSLRQGDDPHSSTG
jgi:hypothetical protein